MTEVWLPVAGYENLYQVSDLGRVRSLDRWVPYQKSRRFHRGTILSPFKSPPTNYLTVSLGRDGRSTNRRVHVLVLEAFVGPRPDPSFDACHGPGGPYDNSPSNLRWDTKSANAQDTLRAGTHPRWHMTHCKRKHEFTAENTYVNPTSGGRQCKRCVRDNRLRRRLAAA